MNIIEDSDTLGYYAMTIDKQLPIKGLKCLLKIINSSPLDLAQHPRRLELQKHCCENLKSSIMLLTVIRK